MNKRGQSIIEYALIAVLVILGIVYMGPYVLHSIGAHFRSWDVGVRDSFTENITQAPVSDLPYINSDCNCWYTAGDCGSSNNGVQCAANQRIQNEGCASSSMIGCSTGPLSTCKDDDTCCYKYYQQSCGTNPLPITATSGHIPAGYSGPSDGIWSSSACVTYSNANSCYYGQMMYATECSNVSIACCPDPSCDPHCMGTDSPGVTLCAGTDTNLTQNTNLTYESSCITGGPKCQVVCAAGYELNSSHTACIDQFEVAFNVTDSTGCGAGGTCWGSGACPNCTCSGNPNAYPGITVVNNCSFTMCVATGSTVTGVSLTDVSSPETYPYCDNPGNPGEDCRVNFTYH